uniref:Pectinesterase inhibitor domain-containing protein n=1 Tax=Oryza meridionalis TaxID=40149 RepID=A0A0E0EHR2_9ORYZ
MEKPAAVFAVLSMSAADALVLLAGGGGAADACSDWDVPSMSAAAACQNASTARAMSQICADEVGTVTAPDQEANVFVLAAVNAAARSYEATVGYLWPLVTDPSAPGAARARGGAGLRAQQQMGAAAGHLYGCELAELVRDVPAAVVAVDDCATALLQVFGVNSAWYRTVIGDRDRSMLALRLTGLAI